MNRNQSIELNKPYLNVLLTTAEYNIKGKLYLPIASTDPNSSKESLLFYALNCGKKFIQLYDCVISNRRHAEYQPEQAYCYNVNLDIVQTCQIVKED